MSFRQDALLGGIACDDCVRDVERYFSEQAIKDALEGPDPTKSRWAVRRVRSLLAPVRSIFRSLGDHLHTLAGTHSRY